MNHPQSLLDSPPLAGTLLSPPLAGAVAKRLGVVKQDGRPPITIYQSSLPCGWVGWVS